MDSRSVASPIRELPFLDRFFLVCEASFEYLHYEILDFVVRASNPYGDVRSG